MVLIAFVEAPLLRLKLASIRVATAFLLKICIADFRFCVHSLIIELAFSVDLTLIFNGYPILNCSGNGLWNSLCFIRCTNKIFGILSFKALQKVLFSIVQFRNVYLCAIDCANIKLTQVFVSCHLFYCFWKHYLHFNLQKVFLLSLKTFFDRELC